MFSHTPARGAEPVQADHGDAGSSADLDDLAWVAAQLCDAPYAVLSFVDAAGGPSVHAAGFAPEEVAVASGIAMDLVRAGERLEVADAQHDERWRDHPWVAGAPGIRFMASVPLIAPNGAPIGTLAVMDVKPRSLIDRQRDALDRVSRIAVAAPRRAASTATMVLDAYQTALDEHAMVSVTDAHGRITYANDKFCAVSQYTREELLGRDHRLINAQYHPKSFFRTLWTTIESGRPWHGELKNRAKDGAYFWVDTTIVPIVGANGKPEHYLAIRNGITQHKRTEAALADTASRLRLATAAAHVGIWEWDIARNTLEWDAIMYQLYGITPNTFSGAYAAWEAGLHPDDREGAVAALQGAVRGERDFDSEFRVVWPDGTEHVIEASAAVLRDADGEALRVIGTNRDITDRRRYEREQAEQLSSALSDVQTLSNLLPKCAWCERVRDDQGYWDEVGAFFAKRDNILWSHSICPSCAAAHFARDGS